jgi:hypothetical protein
VLFDERKAAGLNNEQGDYGARLTICTAGRKNLRERDQGTDGLM